MKLIFAIARHTMASRTFHMYTITQILRKEITFSLLDEDMPILAFWKASATLHRA